MELFGKVVSPQRGSLNLNGNEELLINIKSGRITLSAALLTKLDWADKAIGFGYDPAGDLGNAEAKAYIYAMSLEEGCKVGTSGTVTSKWHASKLEEAFIASLNGSNRAKLDVNVDGSIIKSSIIIKSQ